MSKWLFRCMLVGSSLTVQGLQWNYLHGSSLGSAPWPLGMPGLWWIKPLKQKRVWSTMIHLARGFMCCFPGKASATLIITWSKSIWTLAGAIPSCEINLSIDHPRWGARHPWQSFGRSLGTVQHHGFGFLQTWHTVVQKMVKRCWKMMRSKWYQI